MPLVVVTVKSRALTSGLTTMLMSPSSSTVGVNASEMPNSLNSTVIAASPAAEAPLCATSIGNSPPARKLAVSPDRAMRFGSARVLATPLVSSASNRICRPVLPTFPEKQAAAEAIAAKRECTGPREGAGVGEERVARSEREVAVQEVEVQPQVS